MNFPGHNTLFYFGLPTSCDLQLPAALQQYSGTSLQQSSFITKIDAALHEITATGS